jgi:hypothetical protein
MPRYNSKVNGLKAKSCLKQRGIGKPKSNNHKFFEQIKTILLRVTYILMVPEFIMNDEL